MNNPSRKPPNLQFPLFGNIASCFILPQPCQFPVHSYKRTNFHSARPRHATVVKTTKRARIVAEIESPSNTTVLRERVIDLVRSVGREGGTEAEQVQQIELAISDLLAARASNEVAPVAADDLDATLGLNWQCAMQGRWELAFSTERPLLRLMTVGAYPFFATGDVYQLFEADGKIQNVVEFRKDVERGTIPAVMRVGVEYEGDDNERRCDFEFRTTRFQIGKSAQKSIMDANGLKELDDVGGWLNLDFKFNFAIGKGFFRVIWLDHALRIDRDTSNGNDWLNIYLYNGPVERCGTL